MNVLRKFSDASRRGLVCAVALTLLLGASGAAAAEEFRIAGTGAALGTMRLLAEAFTAGNPDIRIAVTPSLGSSGGIKAVLHGAIGLAVSSRALKDSERRSGAVAVEYARTPFVLAVSTRSKVSAISSRELADIYARKTQNWPDGSPARVVLRPDSDIDTELVKSISPGIRRALDAARLRPGVKFAVNDQDAADDLEHIGGAIGPSTLALILSEQRALRALKLDGIEPTPANAAAGTYPYYKRLFMVTGAKRPPAVERFVAFVRSARGRAILEQNGQWIP